MQILGGVHGTIRRDGITGKCCCRNRPVRFFPPSSPPLSTLIRTSHMDHSKVILPTELELLVLEFIRLQHSRLSLSTNYDRKAKQGLTNCSLTCYRWSVVFRPFLFRSISLHSPEDLFFLLDLITTHGECFAEMVHRVEIIETRGHWLHRALFNLPRKLPELTILRLLGLRAGSARSVEQINAARPPNFFKLVPVLCHQFRHIQHLILEELTFGRFHEMTNCVSSFPSLTHLQCHHVTWLESTDPQGLFSPRLRCGRFLTDIRVRACALPWRVMRLLVTETADQPMMPPINRPMLSPSCTEAFVYLLKVLTHGYEDCSCTFTYRDVNSSTGSSSCKSSNPLVRCCAQDYR